MIQRAFDAAHLNAILNHPRVRPDVADISEGDLDLSDRVANTVNVCLVGQYGAFFCYKYYDGCYEVHTAVLPEGRGQWARDFAEAGARYMFTVTDCTEIMTRVPQGHVAAKALTEAMGFRHQFTTPAVCRFRGQMVPAHIYSLTLQEWSVRADGMEEAGAEFHEWLNRQIADGKAHDPDPAHNRIVGIALQMALAGMLRKAVVWYNRCAFAGRHAPIALISENPPQIRFDAGVLTLTNDGLKLERTH